MRVGIYCQDWNEAGDSVFPLLCIAQNLSECGWKVSLYGPTAPKLDYLQQQFEVDLRLCSAGGVAFAGQWAKQILAAMAPRIYRFLWGRAALSFSRNENLLISLVWETPAFCPAKRSILFVIEPPDPASAIKLDSFETPLRAADRDKKARLDSYNLIVTSNSRTARAVKSIWNTDSFVLFPPVHFEKRANTTREQIIILNTADDAESVQRARCLLGVFRLLSASDLACFQLIVLCKAGGGIDSQVKLLSSQNNLVSSVDPADISSIYNRLSRASMIWDVGIGSQTTSRNPARTYNHMQILGRSMHCGVVPVVYGEGLPTEIVRRGIDGLYWFDEATLVSATRALLDSPDLMAKFSAAAVSRSQLFQVENFNQKFDALLVSLQERAAA